MTYGSPSRKSGAAGNSDDNAPLMTGLTSLTLLFAVFVAAAGSAEQAGGRTASPALVPYERLVPLLPQLTGWTREAPDGETTTAPMPMSVARANYQKGESTMSVEIIDTALSRMLVTPFTMMTHAGFYQKNGKGYDKAATVAGFPGVESWYPEDGATANVVVIVGDRYLVKANATGVTDPTPARGALEAIDLKALAAM
jgi:hypothetical protein